MKDALAQVGKSTGKNFVFSLCEWGWVRNLLHCCNSCVNVESRVKYGCELPTYVPCPDCYEHSVDASNLISWGAEMGHSWRVRATSSIFIRIIFT